MNRLARAYATAWRFSKAFGEPVWLQWLWRLIIFGGPISFLIGSVFYMVEYNDWVTTFLAFSFVLTTHPLAITFIYHDFYELVCEELGKKEKGKHHGKHGRYL